MFAAIDDKEPPALIEQLRRLAGVSARKREFRVQGVSCEVEVEWQIDESGERIVLLASFPDAGESAQGGYRGRGAPVIESDGPIAIYLREENSIDRARKMLGGAEELQTGDAEFDAAVYVETHTDRRVASQLLRHEGARGAIVQLLRSGCSSIVLGDWSGKIVVHVARAEAPCTDPGHAKRIVGHLDALRGSLPAVVQRQVGPKSTTAIDRTPRTFGQAVVAAIVAAIVGSVVAGTLAFAFFLVFTPGTCYSTDFVSKGQYLSCSRPECCEPAYTGLAWGVYVVPVLWTVVLVHRLVRCFGSTGQAAPWIRFGAMLGASVPIGLALGVMAARLAF